jgi:NAD(P)-dependent dehydrogenase (short-subunit alcohol dehydrogenase family)
MDFTGKRVLITGGAAGVGRMAAELFRSAGATVAIHSPSWAELDRAIKELGDERLVATAGDVATVAGCDAVVGAALARLGGLDVLVNSAENSSRACLMDVTEALWDRVMAANLRSAMFCTKAALPALRATRGNVVMVASTAALMAGPTDQLLFATSKAGLIGMSRNLAIELAPDRIRVNCVAPGFIDTAETRAANHSTGGQIDRYIAASVPLGRLGTERECASAILYLASDAAGYCTGSILVSDGGAYANASWGTKS